MKGDSVNDGVIKYYRSIAVRTLADFDCWLSVQDLCTLAARSGLLEEDRDAEKSDAFLVLAIYMEAVTSNALDDKRFLKLKAGGTLVGLKSWEDEDPNRPNSYQEYLERRAENQFILGSRKRRKIPPLSADRGTPPFKFLDRSKLRFGLKSVQDKIRSESQPTHGRALSSDTPPLTEAGPTPLPFMSFGSIGEAPSTSSNVGRSMFGTVEEEQKIIEGIEKGLSPKEIADALSRGTEEAVRARWSAAIKKKTGRKPFLGYVAKLMEKKIKREPRASIKQEPGSAMHGQSSAMNHGGLFRSPAFPCFTSTEGGRARHEVRDHRMRMSQPPQNSHFEYKRGSFEAEKRCACAAPATSRQGQEMVMDQLSTPLFFAMSNLISVIASDQDRRSREVSHRKSLEDAVKNLKDYSEEKIQMVSAMETANFRSLKAGTSEGARMKNTEKRALLLQAVEMADILILALMRDLAGGGSG